MFSSRKDLIALAVAVGAGVGVTFLLKYAGGSSTYLLFAFQILVIPLMSTFADHRNLSYGKFVFSVLYSALSE